MGHRFLNLIAFFVTFSFVGFIAAVIAAKFWLPALGTRVAVALGEWILFLAAVYAVTRYLIGPGKQQ
jgi:hypothetical protein